MTIKDAGSIGPADTGVEEDLPTEEAGAQEVKGQEPQRCDIFEALLHVRHPLSPMF